ncbi:MAG: Hint domain-containing protein, partial [Proteobacteria bacterium]|nr:Hint domain-containing protein [Pseudomonadota bacterium]
TLTLDGAGSTLTVGGALTIGAAGTGIGAVTGGASASVADDVTLAELAGSTGTLTLSGTGSALTAESGLTVGGGGSAGIKVQSGAQLSVGGDMTVGEQAGADGTVTVTAPGASLGVDGNLTLGAAGHGVMVLQGVTASVGGTAITLGEQVTGSGTLTLEGAALVFGGVLTVGGAGYGQMLLQQGALMTPDTIVIGEDTGSVGELHVDGALTSVTSHVLTVGSSGRGTLTVTNGAELVTNGDASVGELVSGVVSTATVDTGGTWSLLGGLTIGSGGKATMLVQGQGRVLAGGDIVLGEVGSGFGSVTVSGASVLGPAVTWHGTLAVGDAGTGLLTIQSGATVADAGGAGRIEIGAGAGTGTVTVTGAGSELRGTVVAVDHGLLQINAGGVVSVVDAEVHAGGTISLAGGSLLTDPVSVDADGNITGNGTITGAIATAGTITAAGGTLTLTDDVTGPGTLAIADNATLDLHGNAADTLTVHFAGGGSETLLLGLPLGMQASIDGFFKGDAILFGPYDTVFSEFAGDVLSVYSGGLLIASLHFIGSYTADDFNVVAQNGTVTVSTDVLCFLRGTQIATPDGAMPVEALREGDLVLTHAGDAKPVIWIGRGRVLATRGRRTAATPVVVRKNALAPNVPNHDLRVTKAHSLFLDGVLIPVEFLVNHRSICWDDHAQEVEIFHVELEQHDVLLANGTPAETYRDDGNRWLFQNANAAWHLPPKPPCAPVVTDGPIVDRVWRRILDRAGPRPGWPLTQDPDLHLMVDGQRLDGLALSPQHYVFTLPAGASHLRIVSRSAAPQQLGLNRDPRELGAAIARIVIAQDGHQRTIDACDPRLAEGFYGFEPEIGVRWTGGDALLPAALWRGFGAGAELQIWLNGRTFYPDEPARKAA